MCELTVTSHLANQCATWQHAPALTSLSLAGRAELSYQTTLNWAAKTAGLLRAELGLSPGEVVSLHLPIGWPAAVIALGAWWAGLGVQTQPGADIAFVCEGADSPAEEVFVVSSHPLGLAQTDILCHQRHFGPAVLVHDDHFRPGTLDGGQLVAVADPDGPLTHSQVLAAAAGLAAGTRLLSQGPLTGPWFVHALMGPLLAGGSAVCAAADYPTPDLIRAARAEGVTAHWPSLSAPDLSGASPTSTAQPHRTSPQ